jgi:RimJ/RimL family protein N-acetyltransferase
MIDSPRRDPAGPLVRAGNRVSLHRHIPAQRDIFAIWYQDAEIARLLRHDLRPLNAMQARGYFDSIILPASASNTCWAIHENSTGHFIGSTAVTEINAVHASSKFRIVIGEKSCWSMGYGTEATALVAAEAFANLGLRTIRLEVFTHNLRAFRAYRRVGFVQTGSHEEWVASERRRLGVIEMELRAEDFTIV